MFSLSDTPCQSILPNDGKIATKLWLAMGPFQIMLMSIRQTRSLGSRTYIYIYIYVFLQNFTVAESADSSLIIVVLLAPAYWVLVSAILEQFDSAPREVFQRELDQAENARGIGLGGGLSHPWRIS